MKCFVIVVCLIVMVMARPEPELPSNRYSYNNGLSSVNHHQQQSNNLQANHHHQQGYQISSGYSTGGGYARQQISGGIQVPYDEGEFTPSHFGSNGQNSHVYRVSSQNLENSNGHHYNHHHEQQQHQQQLEHQSQNHHNSHQQHQEEEEQQNNYVEQQQSHHGSIGHRTYGLQHQQQQQLGEDQQQHLEVDVTGATNAGEGLIDPRLNDNAPPVFQRGFVPSIRESTNNYVLQSQQNSYASLTGAGAGAGTQQLSYNNHGLLSPTYVPSIQQNHNYESSSAALTQNSYDEAHRYSGPSTTAVLSSYQQPPPSHTEYSTSDAAGNSYYPLNNRQIIHKHVYVHVPPKEFDEEPLPIREHFPIQPAQKHYKIIFIKAPSPPQYRPPILAPIPQNEEKTLIYVLHKKPEQPEDIIIPTAAPTQPSKPEVYFIKYKTRKESNNLSGLYNAPAPVTAGGSSFTGASESSSSSIGYSDTTGYSSSSSTGPGASNSGQHTSGPATEIEHETNIPTESEHYHQHQQHSNNEESSSSSLQQHHNLGPISTPSTSYGPSLHKTESN